MRFVNFALIAGSLLAVSALTRANDVQLDARAQGYILACEQLTSIERHSCFDLLPSRIPGYKREQR
jgi:hypothetical protein